MSYPTRTPSQLPQACGTPRWLIESLWLEHACGMIGGEPKCCKSQLALAMAVAVASGRACLGRFAVAEPAAVLVYAAEDPPHIVRHRIQGICHAAATPLETLNIELIGARSMRLDIDCDREKLFDTVERVRPKLVILDPLARLHRVNENLSCEIAPLLAALRTLQRRFETAVALVHHARKSPHLRAGQALRGSSDLHAWGDSYLYLARSRGSRLQLSAEHRSAPQTCPVDLQLRSTPKGPALYLDDRQRRHPPAQHA